jgi:hypothetical protein
MYVDIICNHRGDYFPFLPELFSSRASLSFHGFMSLEDNCGMWWLNV